MTVLSRRLPVFARNYSDSMLWLVAVPAAGVALGLLAVLVAERGAGSRPALAALVLVLGAAAGLAPLRYGLPVAIVLASFGGFYLDFVRSQAS